MMFRRILYQLLYGNRVRLTVALVALVSGGAVISAMVNLDFDITEKLTREFRSLGPDLVLSASRSATANNGSNLIDASVLSRLGATQTAGVSYLPYLYLVARANSTGGQSVVIAGTWLDRVTQISPWWKMDGDHSIARSNASHCLIGANVARSLNLSVGSPLELSYQGQSAKLEVAGVIDAGDAEDDQIFVNFPVAQKLANLSGKIELVQFEVPGTPEQIRSYMDQLQAQFPDLSVTPIRQVTEAEGGLLRRIRFLVISMGLLILILTALCVLSTMAALAMERRRDVGLMKAIGGSMQKVLHLFLAEVGVLGVVGGLLGYVLGMALSAWMGRRAFGASISPHWEVLPLTVGLMIVVSLAGALPLRFLGNVRPAVILRGD